MSRQFLKIRSGINLGSLSSDPSDPENGDLYFNTTSNFFKQYTNGAWHNLIGDDLIQSLTNKQISYSVITDSTTTGSNTTLQAADILNGVVRTTNGSLTSLSGIPAGGSGQFIIVENQTGNTITINDNEATATAANRIRTGTGSNVTMLANAAFSFVYDSIAARWILAGGSGSGGLSAWAASTPYLAGAIVSYNKNAYICVTANTSGSTFEADVVLGYWVLLNTPQVSPNRMIVGNTFESNSVGGWTAAHTALTNGLPITTLLGGTAFGTGYYAFTVTSANATVGATYTNNTQTFTVVTTIAAGTLLICTGTGSPTTSGMLTKASGTGDATVTFSAFVSTIKSANTTSPATISSSPISGKFSLNFATSGAGTAGDMYISQPHNIDPVDQAKVLQIKFSYQVVSGTVNLSGTSSNTFGVAIYDVTNNTWIIPAGTFNLVQSSGVGICTATFQTASNATKFQVAIFNPTAPAGATSFYLDDFYVGPQIIVQGAAISDWAVDTSFTFNGVGSLAESSIFSRIVGDTLEVMGEIRTGTVSGTTVAINIPNSKSIDTTKLSANMVVGYGTIAVNANTTIATNNPLVIYYDATNNGVTNSTLWISNNENAQQLQHVAGNAAFTTNDRFFFTFSFPVSGKSSNSVMSADTDTRVVAAIVAATANITASAGNPYLFPSVLTDTTGSYSTATGLYTCPVSGIYKVSAAGIYSSTNNVGNNNWGVYKNGVVYAQLVGMTGGGSGVSGQSGSIDVKCNTGDTLGFYCISTGSVTLTQSIGTVQPVVSFERLSGPATVAATESVNARYFASATSISGSLATINWTTKDFDSHGSMSAGTYTIPVSGKYQVNASLAVAGTFALNSTIDMQLQKNGTAVSESNVLEGGAVTSGMVAVSDLVNCLAGDTIRIQVSTSATGPSIVSSNTKNYFSITRAGN